MPSFERCRFNWLNLGGAEFASITGCCVSFLVVEVPRFSHMIPLCNHVGCLFISRGSGEGDLVN